MENNLINNLKYQILKNKNILCLKCKREFKTELDSKGIPYKKICPLCKKKRVRYARGLIGKL